MYSNRVRNYLLYHESNSNRLQQRKQHNSISIVDTNKLKNVKPKRENQSTILTRLAKTGSTSTNNKINSKQYS